jgi:hypothetical protein
MVAKVKRSLSLLPILLPEGLVEVRIAMFVVLSVVEVDVAAGWPTTVMSTVARDSSNPLEEQCSVVLQPVLVVVVLMVVKLEEVTVSLATCVMIRTTASPIVLA